MGWRLDDDLKHLLGRRLAAFDVDHAPHGGLRRAAVAVAVVPADPDTARPHDAAFVLTRRTSKLRAHPGQWALPGGRLDPGEGPADAARRELAEEVGVEVGPESVLGVLDDYPTRSGFAITPVVVWAGEVQDLRPDPSEVASVHRIALSELERPDSPRFVSIPESERPVIQVPLSVELIHAPTAAVLHQFAEVCLAGRTTRVSSYEQPTWAW